MNTTYSIIIGLVLVVGVGGLVFWQKQQSLEAGPAIMETQPSSAAIVPAAGSDDGDEREEEVEFEDGTLPETQPESSGSATTPSAGAGITAAIVATHNSRTSCWSSINGNVYDLTSWIPKHPGGEKAILQLCGKDGSAKFNGQHKGGAPVQTLAGFKIGVLAQ